MSNVDINVDRRTDGRKIGRLYRTLPQAGAIKNDRRFLLTIARSNGVTIKDLIRLKTNTLVSATVSSDSGQLGIDYLTL